MSPRRMAIAVLCAAGFAIAPAGEALAATGHVTDPKGDLPDIRRLDYDNAQRKVVMTLTFANVGDAQNRSFYLQWGKPKKYQVFDSPSAGITELRFFTDASSFRAVDCDGLRVVEKPAANTVKATVPRACLPKAPDRLKFKGVATLGLMSSDQTALSGWVARG